MSVDPAPLPNPPTPRLDAILQDIADEMPDEVLCRIGGDEQVEKNDPPPRIVMCPAVSTIESSGGVPGSLFTRLETVHVHIYGESIAQVEVLIDLFFNAVIEAVTWTIRPGVGTWVKHANTTRGFAVVYPLSFKIPIMRKQSLVRLQLEGPTGEFLQQTPTP